MILPFRFIAIFLLLLGLRGRAATPVMDDPANTPPNFPRGIPVGKTLVFPITAAADAEGFPLSFKVTSSNPKVIARVKTGNPKLRLAVSYGSGQSGVMEFLLFRDWAPTTAAFIGGFAQAGFYDGVKFHRVAKDFIIQAGDPLGTGMGGPGMTDDDFTTAFKFDNEAEPGLIFAGIGQLAMANADPGFKRNGIDPQTGVPDPAYNSSTGYPQGYRFGGSNGSQFFVTTSLPRFLDFKHTIFGQLIRGWSTLAAINNVETQLNSSGEKSSPVQPVTITSATVEDDNHDAVLMLSATAMVPEGATITVTGDDGNGQSTTKTFIIPVVADTHNDPPLIRPMAPRVVAQATQVNMPLEIVDLESDYLFQNHFLLDSGALSTSQGMTAAVLGQPGFSGPVRLALDTRQFSVAAGTDDNPVTRTFVDVAIGDRAIVADDVTVRHAPGAFTGMVARFQDPDPCGDAGDLRHRDDNQLG